MIQESKDTIANITTIAGTTGMVIGFNELATGALLVTGIIFNIVRIIEIRKQAKRDQDQ